MARRRMIDPNIWESEDFNSLSDMERLLFIGMFSLADDEGRGRASSNYLKVKIFPYDNRNDEEIEHGIMHISDKMSVTLYMVGDKRYYQLDHWKEWQTIQKPKPSKIPSPNTDTVQVQYEYSTNTVPVQDEYSLNEMKRNEKKININEMNISGVNVNGVTKQEVIEYGWSNGIQEIVCKDFYDYNSSRGWMLKGEPMKNWKTALEAWNRKLKKSTSHNYDQHDPTDIKVNMVDLDAED